MLSYFVFFKLLVITHQINFTIHQWTENCNLKKHALILLSRANNIS